MTATARRLVAFLGSVILIATEGSARPSPELVIEAPPELAAVAGEVETIGIGDFTGALVITGLMGFTAPISVLLEPEDGELASRTPAWVSGFADGASRTIVLFPDRVSSYPDTDLEALVHHEVAHVLVAEAAHGRPVPRWFNEGVATIAAREWGIEDRARYAAAVVGRGPRTTAELDAGFAEGGRRAVRAYALAGAFVRWMQAEYGRFVTAEILESVSGDRPFDDAFLRATGDTLERAEYRFFVREALWHTWVPFLSSSGVLWAAITALAIVAIRRRRLRSLAMRMRWDEEERQVADSVSGGASRGVGGRCPHTSDDPDDDVVN